MAFQRGTYNSCENWDYGDHPGVSSLQARCDFIEDFALRFPLRIEPALVDSRRAHKFLFYPFVPGACDCLAGHYRGELFPELVHYVVGVGGDRRVGTEPHYVHIRMQKLADKIQAAISGLRALSSSGVPPNVFLVKLAEVLAIILELFLTIHPYANGNGHIGRLMVKATAQLFSQPTPELQINESPPYHDALSAHRNNDHKPLIKFLLRAMAQRDLANLV